jgi:hypothetical protein
VLRQQAGMRRARQVATAEAAFAGACDGELAVGPLLDAVADLVGTEMPVATVREMVHEGWFEPVPTA